jgi:hypothetical protein
MRVIDVNSVRPLLRRGLATMPTIRNIEKAIGELATRLEDPDVALLVEGDGFLIAENNESSFVDACVVIHVYNGAHDMPTLRRLIAELEAFALEGGRARIHGFDINESRAFSRLMVTGRDGWSGCVLGTAYEFARV